MKLLQTSLQLQGFPMQKATQEMQKIMAFSAMEKEIWTEGKKLEIVQHHFQHTAFYQKHCQQLPTNWNQVPIMTKKDLQQPLQDRLSKGYTPKNCFINKTSGSSGTPFIFAIDKHAHALTWANNMRLFADHGIYINRDLQARFYGIPLDFFPNKKEKLKDFLANRIRFNVFNLSDNVLEGYVKIFRKKPFVYLNGYTNSMVVFASYLRKKQLVLKEICPTLKAVFPTSEMLFETDKQLMEQAFGVKIINEYGASELGIIAMDSPAETLVLNNQTLFTEIVDDNGNQVQAGEQGRVLVTALFNKAHPMIRYEIGDLAIKSENGNQLKQLVGRTNDMAILSNGKKIPGLTFYYVTKSVIKDNLLVKEMVIKQTSFTHFEVHYTADANLSETEKTQIQEAFKLYVGADLVVDLIKKDAILRSKSGKLKQFECLMLV